MLYGESLGTGIAVWAATTHAVGAVVLESPYTSIAAAAQYHYPFIPAAWLVSDRYDSLSRIGQVRAPVLMLHGARDGVIPLEPRRGAVRRRPGAEGAMDRAARPGMPISAGSARSTSRSRSSSGTSGRASRPLRADPIVSAAAVAKHARNV